MLVLGDVPLAGRRNQIVLVHQPNLLAPSVNPNVGRTWTMRIMRSVFRRNHPMANALIVQTEVMGDQLAQSYDGLRGRMSVIPQPPPTWALHTEAHSKQPTVGQFDLFYPAAGYPHKNHQLLTGMTPSLIEADPSVGNVKISITLETELANQFDFPATIENLGRLDVSQVQQVYQRSDALFFPSLLESLGLPLVEAIFMNLPVVCANPPYAQWLCEDQAFYFDPSSPADAVRAIKDLRQKLDGGWHPDYRKTRAKLPESWQLVAERFLDLLNKI